MKEEVLMKIVCKYFDFTLLLLNIKYTQFSSSTQI